MAKSAAKGPNVTELSSDCVPAGSGDTSVMICFNIQVNSEFWERLFKDLL